MSRPRAGLMFVCVLVFASLIAYGAPKGMDSILGGDTKVVETETETETESEGIPLNVKIPEMEGWVKLPDRAVLRGFGFGIGHEENGTVILVAVAPSSQGSVAKIAERLTQVVVSVGGSPQDASFAEDGNRGEFAFSVNAGNQSRDGLGLVMRHETEPEITLVFLSLWKTEDAAEMEIALHGFIAGLEISRTEEASP